jgi:hypothetical protein
VGSAIRSDYGFAADAALEAASAAALAAAAESAAAEAAESAAAAGGGGVGSAAGAGASVLLPQALSTNAATKALKASLVFIYRYPRNFKDKKYWPSVLFWAFTQKSAGILEGFATLSYLFRPALHAFNVPRGLQGVKCSPTAKHRLAHNLA